MHVLQVVQWRETKIRHSEMEWAVRTVSGFLIATIPSEEAQKILWDQVSKLSMDGESGAGDADTSRDSGDNRTLEEIMEHGNVEAALRHNSSRKGPGLPFMG